MVVFRSWLTLALLLSLLLVSQSATAGEVIRLYGEENVGTAGAQFLRVPVGARAVAMGKAYSSLGHDGSALFWNPAGLLRTEGRKNFFFSHSEYAADISLDYLSFHGRGQNYGYGISFGALQSGDILRTDELHQDGTGQYFNANQFFVGLSLARAMTDRFSIGGTVKYFQENLDEFQASSVMADLGVLYFVGFGDTRVGFSVRNFGQDIQPTGSPPPQSDGFVASDSFQKFAAPTVGSFGVARTWALGKEVTFLSALDFAHPSDYKESFRMGGELTLMRMFHLRAGFETSRDEGGFSAGFGVEVNRKRERFNFKLDYAYSDLGTFGTIHHFSVDLAPLVRQKDPLDWRKRER
ncbi:MAG: hypothetical protein ACI9UK_001234 [Candidatus Krumholzibacteriia bacterium]|jgi:hypothetical protein